MKPYPSYKDSGVDWIGEIPSGWKTLKCGFLFRVVSIKDNIGEKNLSVYRDYGVILRDSRDDNHNRVSEDISSYKLVEVGNFVFNKMKCWMGSLGVSNYRGIVSPSYTVCETTRPVNRKYLHYILRSKLYIQEFEKLSYGVRVGQWELRFHDFRDILSLLPSTEEQQQISNYLDQKTKQIDDLIEKTKQKIKLLKENRTSLINHCVTKGLDPNVEIKDSGVKWVGEIPRGWEVRRLKYFSTLLTEKEDTKNTDIKISPENVESFTGKCFDLYSEYSGQGVPFKSGDLLINKLRLYLVKILLPDYNGFSMGEMIVIRVDKRVLNKYYFYLFFNQGLMDLLDSQSTGIKVPRVSPEVIMGSYLPLPLLTEQQQIVTHLDNETQKIDTLIEKENKRIKLLKEYRQSLISEVVTGKIDVREEVLQ